MADWGDFQWTTKSSRVTWQLRSYPTLFHPSIQFKSIQVNSSQFKSIQVNSIQVVWGQQLSHPTGYGRNGFGNIRTRSLIDPSQTSSGQRLASVTHLALRPLAVSHSSGNRLVFKPNRPSICPLCSIISNRIKYGLSARFRIERARYQTPFNRAVLTLSCLSSSGRNWYYADIATNGCLRSVLCFQPVLYSLVHLPKWPLSPLGPSSITYQ